MLYFNSMLVLFSTPRDGSHRSCLTVYHYLSDFFQISFYSTPVPGMCLQSCSRKRYTFFLEFDSSQTSRPDTTNTRQKNRCEEKMRLTERPDIWKLHHIRNKLLTHGKVNRQPKTHSSPTSEIKFLHKLQVPVFFLTEWHVQKNFLK